MILPCIEISGGRAVHAPAGGKGGVDEIVNLVEPLARCGGIVLLDRDAETLSGDNTKLVGAVCARFGCWVMGGVRNQDRGRALLRAGAEKIVLSSTTGPELLSAFRPEHVVLEVDCAANATRDVEPLRRLFDETRGRCSGYLVVNPPLEAGTDVPDREHLRKLTLMAGSRLVVEYPCIAIDEIAVLDRMGVDAMLGRPVLDGTLSVPEAVVRCVIFGDDPMVPTVVVDSSSQVLMVSYSSPRSLDVALRSGEGTYHDPARGGVWRKGESSGNDQLLLRCRPSHDRRSLLFTVRQAGTACESSYSWFGDREFSLDFLSRIAASKRSTDPAASYTARLLDDPGAIEARLKEKVGTVCTTRQRDETLWAIADLVYYLVVKAVSRNLTWSDVVRELRGRQR